MTRQIFAHPGQSQMQVEVILASLSPVAEAPPIFTIRMRYPRIIHGEIMTHRMFSRNARSSRAVPVKTMLNEVRTIPFVPWHWGKNQKGMQAGEDCSEPVVINPEDAVTFDGQAIGFSRENAWLFGRDQQADLAEAYMTAGYHKQIPNRLLEPFSWIDTLITSTDWANFLWLRDHADAEPHLQDLARLVKQAIDAAALQQLAEGEWHLPYVTWEDQLQAAIFLAKQGNHPDFVPHKSQVKEMLRKLSAARCARISYKPFDGDASYEKELERYDNLVKSDRVHASPLEHQATPDDTLTVSVDLFENDNESGTPDQILDARSVYRHKEKHGNLTGWIQNRKLIPNERHRG